MKKYASVNAKYYKLNEFDRIINHNLRQSKINYLLEKEYIKYENQNIIYNENLEQSISNQNNFQIDLLARYELVKLINKRKAIQEKNKYFGNPNSNDLIEMVVALSEEQAKSYLDNGEDLSLGFDNFAKNIKKEYGLTPLQCSLHFDEGYVENGQVKNNIHCHVVFFNYDFEKEKSVLRNLRKKDFSNMQDIVEKSFKEVGFDFVRGISKEITNKKHLERNDHIIQKQIIEINSKKNEYKELLKTFKKGSIDYQDLYKKIGSLQDQEKTLRTNKRDLIQKIKNDTKSIIENSKSLLGMDKDKLENNIGETLIKYSNIKNLSSKEILLEQENTKLKQEIANKNDLIAQKDKRIETITNHTKQLEKAFMVNYKQLEQLKNKHKQLDQQNKKLRNRTIYLNKTLKDKNITLSRDMIRKALNKPILKNKEAYQLNR